MGLGGQDVAIRACSDAPEPFRSSQSSASASRLDADGDLGPGGAVSGSKSGAGWKRVYNAIPGPLVG